MRGRSGQTGLWLEAACLAHSKPGNQVGVVLVVDDHRHPSEGRSVLLPSLDCRLPARQKRREPRLVNIGVRRVDLRKARGQRIGHLGDVARIEMDVRIAARMDVAHRAIDDLGNLDARDELRGFQVTRRPGLDSRVAGLREKQRQPADFEIRAGTQQEVGRARSRNQAGTRLDAMRILQCRGGRVDRDPIAADLVRKRRPFGLAGQDVDRGRGLQGNQRGAEQRQEELEDSVHRGLRTCAHHAPRGS